MIWFVGAGPGAEDLITVRGQQNIYCCTSGMWLAESQDV